MPRDMPCASRFRVAQSLAEGKWTLAPGSWFLAFALGYKLWSAGSSPAGLAAEQFLIGEIVERRSASEGGRGSQKPKANNLTAQRQDPKAKSPAGPCAPSPGSACEDLASRPQLQSLGRAIRELDDPQVRQYASAVAWHGYAGDASVMSRVHGAHPEAAMHW